GRYCAPYRHENGYCLRGNKQNGRGAGGSFPADTLRAVLSYPAGPIPTKWDHLLGPGAASSRKQITPKRATTSASWPSSFPIEYRIAAVGIFAVHTPAFKR